MMSRSTSMPGAISLSSSPSGVRTNTQRSVTYSTCCPREVATAPLKVMCSTSFTNFLAVPSLTMISLSFSIARRSLPALKVPTNMTFLAFWLMLMKPAGAGKLGPELADV